MSRTRTRTNIIEMFTIIVILSSCNDNSSSQLHPDTTACDPLDEPCDLPEDLSEEEPLDVILDENWSTDGDIHITGDPDTMDPDQQEVTSLDLVRDSIHTADSGVVSEEMSPTQDMSVTDQDEDHEDTMTVAQLAAPCLFDSDCLSNWCSNGFCSPVGFSYVPSSTFTMGSPPGEIGQDVDEQPQHLVSLTNPFYFQSTEVTQQQWHLLMDAREPFFPGCGEQCPQEQVSWWDAVSYANALSESEGLTACYILEGCAINTFNMGLECESIEVNTSTENPLHCIGYRLPVEAEWELAARAGTTTPLFNGSIEFTSCRPDETLEQIGWFCGNSDNSTHPVAQKLANDWGIYDSSGNVWEWLWDWYEVDYYSTSPELDPTGAEESGYRVCRGGSWENEADYLRNARRGNAPPARTDCAIGFRMARTAFPSSCFDGIENGDEGGLDCGGSCTPC